MNQPIPHAHYVPAGHPVRRFVLGIAVVAALLGAVWWSGIGRPLLRVEVREVRPDGATVALTNEGRTTIELRAVAFEDPRLDGESVELPTGSLSSGESVDVRVTYSLQCSPAPDGGYYVPMRVTARTAVGLERTVTAGGVDSSNGVAVIGDLACDTADDGGAG
jgi:hypothetical protein